jgi:hypothetical protein
MTTTGSVIDALGLRTIFSREINMVITMAEIMMLTYADIRVLFVTYVPCTCHGCELN